MNKYIPCVLDDKKQYKRYIRMILANSCMPTLTLHKPSSLIGFQKKECINQESFMDSLQEELSYFPIKFRIFFESKKCFFVFLYQKELLNNCLYKSRNHWLMKGIGYTGELKNLERDIDILKERYIIYQSSKENFPHEIGVFFGYPIGDVEQFILNRGENYLAYGYWKVYMNLEEAIQTFCLFNKLKQEAIRLLLNERNLWEING